MKPYALRLSDCRRPHLTRTNGIWLCCSPDAFGLGRTVRRACRNWYINRIARGEVA